MPLNIGDKWGVKLNWNFFLVNFLNTWSISELWRWKPTPYALKDSYRFLSLYFLWTPLPAPEYPDFESIIILLNLIKFFLNKGNRGSNIDVG